MSIVGLALGKWLRTTPQLLQVVSNLSERLKKHSDSMVMDTALVLFHWGHSWPCIWTLLLYLEFAWSSPSLSSPLTSGLLCNIAAMKRLTLNVNVSLISKPQPNICRQVLNQKSRFECLTNWNLCKALLRIVICWWALASNRSRLYDHQTPGEKMVDDVLPARTIIFVNVIDCMLCKSLGQSPCLLHRDEGLFRWRKN